ncbi:hypothetical protein Tco_0222180 [Tanacetum coccineum]
MRDISHNDEDVHGLRPNTVMSSDSASSEVTYMSISSHGDPLAWAVDFFRLQEPDSPETAPAPPDVISNTEIKCAKVDIWSEDIYFLLDTNVIAFGMKKNIYFLSDTNAICSAHGVLKCRAMSVKVGGLVDGKRCHSLPTHTTARAQIQQKISH